MEARLLSYLYLYADDSEKATEVGAGDLASSNLPTGLTDSVYLNSTHELLATLYNGMINGTFPGLALNLPNFFINPSVKLVGQDFKQADRYVGNIYKTLNKIIPFSYQSVMNYHYLWYSYINGRFSVSVFCYAEQTSCKNITESSYKLPTENQFSMLEKLRNNTANGVLLEGELNGHPCLDTTIISTFKIKEICEMLKLMSENSNQFLKMMKYVIQSPVYIEEEEEYLSIFKHANLTLSERGFFFKENKVY